VEEFPEAASESGIRVAMTASLGVFSEFGGGVFDM